MSSWLGIDETQLATRGLVTLTLQRVEKRNALTPEMLDAVVRDAMAVAGHDAAGRPDRGA